MTQVISEMRICRSRRFHLIRLPACGAEAEKDWSGLTLVQSRIWNSGESNTISVEQSSQVCAPRTPLAALI